MIACSSSRPGIPWRGHAASPRRPGARAGPSCPGGPRRRPSMPEQPRHGEAPDVGVEDPDDQSSGRQCDGQVDRDRGLADAALARRDGEHPGGGSDGRLGRVLPGLPAGPRHDRRPLVGVHGGRPRPGPSAPSRVTARGSTTSRSIWLRSGQAAMVSATSTVTSPPSTMMSRTMPRSTMVSPSSGSITARSRSRTSPRGCGPRRGRARAASTVASGAAQWASQPPGRARASREGGPSQGP